MEGNVHLLPFLSICAFAPAQFSGLYAGLRCILSSQAVSVLQPSLPSSNRLMQILTGGFLIPLGLPPWPLAKPGRKGFHVSSSGTHPQPSHLCPISPLLEAREGGTTAPAIARTREATRATTAITTATSAALLNLGSCLLFPARASGCLLLGSAHPLGSTVRLSDPAQGRQTGLRTSVLPWRTGSRKRRYETEPLSLASPLLPAALDSPISLSVRLLQSLQTLPLCQLTPSLPGLSALSCHDAAPMPPLSSPHSQENARGLALTQRYCGFIMWLCLIFSSLFYLNLARGGEKEVRPSGQGCSLITPGRERRGLCTRQVRGPSDLCLPHRCCCS